MNFEGAPHSGGHTGIIADRTGSYSSSFIIVGVIAAAGAVIYRGLVGTPINPKSLAEVAE